MKNKEVVENLLVQVQCIQEHLRNFDSICSFLLNDGFGHITIDTGDIRSRLCEKELALWQAIGMWGLTLDDKTRDRIKCAVYDRMLKGKSVCEFLSDDGTPPGRWLASDEKEFREMARKAFAPSV